MKKVELDKIDLETRKHSFEKFILGYTNTSATQEAKRCLNCKNPSCVKACPIGNHIPDFIKEVVAGNIEGAYQILLERTVLPEICGTVCPHEKQCQGSCVKGIKGNPLTIGALEGYVAEYVRVNGLEDLNYNANGKNVAVVGSGPAGMAAAYYLAKKGFEVTIYEKEDYLGGVLTWGIPSFRLDKQIVKNFFEKLNKLNVKFVMNCNVGKDIALEEINNKYDFVILGVGALLPNKMNVEGEDLDYVIQAKTFLTDISKMDKDQLSKCDKYGKHIVVVGGGNVAIDAARSAIRLPGVQEVKILYRRKEEQMPVNSEELVEAKEEDVKIVELIAPIKFNNDHKIECALMKLGEADESGRSKPIDTGERVCVNADTVIMAVGFRNDPNVCKDCVQIKKDKNGRFIVDENYQTTLPNVYAVGDGVSGADTVVNAMKQALIACRHISND